MQLQIVPGPIKVFLRRLVGGFLFVPSIIAIGGVVLAIAAVWIDRGAKLEPVFEFAQFLNINATGARSVLSTIAGAMMTVISLVYSLTLVVFTLAASNIGPRLLESFTDNRVNQTTIGLLGATFLYALIVLYIVGDEEVPKLSVAIAILLATVSLFWLIYFVNNVARSVKVDNEIARTQHALRAAIHEQMRDEPDDHSEESEYTPESEGIPIKAPSAGYIRGVDIPALKAIAEETGGFVQMCVRPGDYVVAGSPLARVFDGATEADTSAILATILIGDTRAPEGDIRFHMHLAVEIALRALSPGINDSYTAISAIDHLSGSLATILQRGVPRSLHCNNEGTPRVWMEIMGMKEIVGVVMHPLRRAARGNVLVTLRLVQAIGMIASVANKRHGPILHRHLLLIATDNNTSITNRDDRRELASAIRTARMR